MPNRWGNIKTVTDFILLDSKITADGNCHHEIKTHLLLERKAMTNLDSILKSRNITLPTKVRLVKAMFFPVVMLYMDVSLTIKKAEHWRIDAFELWCWRRLLRVPQTTRRSNQSILKEVSPGCSLEGLMKLKPQYFGHLMQRAVSLEKTLMLGKTESRRRRGRQRMRWWTASLTWWTWVWVDSGSWWWTGRPGVLQFMGSQRVGHDWATELSWKSKSEVWNLKDLRQNYLAFVSIAFPCIHWDDITSYSLELQKYEKIQYMERSYLSAWKHNCSKNIHFSQSWLCKWWYKELKWSDNNWWKIFLKIKISGNSPKDT